jgi:hypothetical protein
MLKLRRHRTELDDGPLYLNRAARRRIARDRGRGIARKAIAAALRDDHVCPIPERSLRVGFGWRLDRW